jgi:hypothetical protein
VDFIITGAINYFAISKPFRRDIIRINNEIRYVHGGFICNGELQYPFSLRAEQFLYHLRER